MFEIAKEQAIRDILNDGGTSYTDTESKLTKVVDNEGDMCHCWCDAPVETVLCTCREDPDSHCRVHGMSRPGMNRPYSREREDERRAEQRMEDYYGGFGD